MIGIFNTITITYSSVDHVIYRPNDFSPSREEVYSGEITTCTGALIADHIGWRYSDLTMSWGALPTSQVLALINMPASAVLKFTDADKTEHSENIIVSKKASVGSRDKNYDGSELWHDINLEVRFPDVHND